MDLEQNQGLHSLNVPPAMDQDRYCTVMYFLKPVGTDINIRIHGRDTNTIT